MTLMMDRYAPMMKVGREVLPRSVPSGIGRGRHKALSAMAWGLRVSIPRHPHGFVEVSVDQTSLRGGQAQSRTIVGGSESVSFPPDAANSAIVSVIAT